MIKRLRSTYLLLVVLHSMFGQGLGQWCKLPQVMLFNIKDVLDLTEYTSGSKNLQKVIYAICLTSIWCIWRARNEAVFTLNNHRCRGLSET
ncbi:hypothetical protein HanIR_Chr13g0630451 [Helianthus annuus]|nr:hypothetical protein HanIR_Chr13g0630451 [Helianthus annuus]